MHVQRAPAYEPLSVVLVDGSTVELVYDAVLDAASVPPVGAFVVSVGGSTRAVSSVSVAGQVVRLVLASPVLSSQDIVVSYMVPWAPGEHRIEATSGAAAVGFGDRAVVVPPGPPSIIGVGSSADGLAYGLDVSWTSVVGSSGYELQWRQQGEQTWQSARAGLVQRFTIGGLVRGVLYDVRVRAVKTGGGSGAVLYVTGWSVSESGVAGAWTPANVSVTTADKMLIVGWDDVPVATGYEVEYWPTRDVSDRTGVVPDRDGTRWRADISGLVNSEPLGGDDILVGGDGDDTIYGGNATLIGMDDGDDLLWGGTGDDTLYGGNGKDTLYDGVGDDSLAGNRRNDMLYSGDGDDTIVGGGENDIIYGGAGDDILDGHAHDDTVYGGVGDDMVRGGDGDDILWGNTGDDTLTGGTGDDIIYGGPGADRLDGNTQNDMLWGGSGDDTLNGQGHDDQLHGGAGDDTLRGGAADDRVYGGAGDDTLDGGNGIDRLDGGPDADTCARGETTTSCETGSERRL